MSAWSGRKGVDLIFLMKLKLDGLIMRSRVLPKKCVGKLMC